MQTLSEGTDNHLILLAQKGDMKAFEELMKRHIHTIKSVISSKARFNPSMIDDSVQLALVKIWQRIETFNRTLSFEAWIKTVASSSHIDQLRKELRYQKYRNLYEVETSHKGKEFQDYDSSLEYWDSKKELVLEVINLLPPHQAQVIRLLFEGRSRKDIAKQLEKPISTIKTRISLAIKKIRASLVHQPC